MGVEGGGFYGHDGWDDQAEEYSLNYLVQDQRLALKQSGVPEEDLDTLAQTQAEKIFAKRKSLDMDTWNREVRREQDMVTEWSVKTNASGEAKLYNEAYDTYLDDLLDKTKRYAEDTSQPHIYNPEEARSLREMQDLLVSKKAQAVIYPTWHPDGVRYMPLMQWKGDKVTSTYIDASAVFGRDLSTQEASIIIDRLGNRFNGEASHQAEYPHATFQTDGISVQSIKETVYAQSLVAVVAYEPQKADNFMEYGGESIKFYDQASIEQAHSVLNKSFIDTITFQPVIPHILKNTSEVDVVSVSPKQKLTKLPLFEVFRQLFIDHDEDNTVESTKNQISRDTKPTQEDATIRLQEKESNPTQPVTESGARVNPQNVLDKNRVDHIKIHDKSKNDDNTYDILQKLEPSILQDFLEDDVVPIFGMDILLNLFREENTFENLQHDRIFTILAEVSKSSEALLFFQKIREYTNGFFLAAQEPELAGGALMVLESLIHDTEGFFDSVAHAFSQTTFYNINEERTISPETFLQVLLKLLPYEPSFHQPKDIDAEDENFVNIGEQEYNPTWILFAIVWYMTAIREHGKRTLSAKPKRQQTNHSLPEIGIIYLYLPAIA